MPDLPPPTVTIACGACGAELDETEDDHLACFDCLLSYDNAEATADYLDPEKEPCGKSVESYYGRRNPLVTVRPFQTTDGVVVRWRETTHEYGSCALPEDHAKGMHHWPITTRFAYYDHDPRQGAPGHGLESER